MVIDPTDNFRFYGTCGLCKKEGFFRRKHKHTTPHGVTVYSRSFMCKSCRLDVENKLSTSETRV